MKTVERLLAFSISEADLGQTPTNSISAMPSRSQRQDDLVHLTKLTQRMSKASFSHKKPNLPLSARSRAAAVERWDPLGVKKLD